MRRRVLLLSTVHPATDPRIFYKIAPSLTKEYDVFCALPHARPDISNEALTLIWLPQFRHLLFRLLFSHWVVLWKCLRIKPDVVHIFVPELIPVALLFKWLGARIIYEVQENLYQKFAIKRYNNALLYQKLFRYFDHYARRQFYMVFTEAAYLQEYDKLAYPSTIIHNYPSISFIDECIKDEYYENVNPAFLYVGVISLERSFDTLIAALAMLKKSYPRFRMHLFGSLRIAKSEMVNLPGYNDVAENLTFYGYVNQKEAFKYAVNAVAGIALLKPVADYPDSYTTKLFEYMSLKLPVITSDFPLYRNVVEHSECGFCISPYKADTLAEKLKWLIANPQERRKMGENGRKAVEKTYNWAHEESQLLSFYQSLVKH